MPLNEQFIPGQWTDTVDVNDFVNLNKKPFLKKPIFLKNDTETSTMERYLKFKELKNVYKDEIELSFPLLENEKIPWLNGDFSNNPFKKKIGFSESLFEMKEYYGLGLLKKRKENRKTAYQAFDDVITNDTKKMFKMNLFTSAPNNFSPSFIQPDIRIIPLYGTKHLIREKRWFLKTLERHFQTQEWVQKRMSLYREIDAIKQFEKFSKKNGLDVSEPANSAEEVLKYLYMTILGCMSENPTIPFSLSQVMPFIDIYTEYEIKRGLLTEEKAQKLIDEFYLQLNFIKFILSPGLRSRTTEEPYVFGETFGWGNLTKTTYRFLTSVKKFKSFPFVIRINWNNELPACFKTFVEDLIKDDIPISIHCSEFHKRNDSLSFHSHGKKTIAGEDILFHAGICDLEKILYLSFNGGKDLSKNINLTPITQPIKGKVVYEEVISKFKDYLSFALNAYVEFSNIIFYLSEINDIHSFRSSLLVSQPYYQIQFGFSNIEKISRLLTSIQQNNYSVSRDEKGWVESINSNSEEINDVIFATITELIEREINKIPLYKSGKPIIRFYHNETNETMNEKEVESKMLIPYELTKSTYHANIVLESETDIVSFIEKQFENGFRELNITINSKNKIIDGVLFVEED